MYKDGRPGTAGPISLTGRAFRSSLEIGYAVELRQEVSASLGCR
jgi:hypothetical protein